MQIREIDLADGPGWEARVACCGGHGLHMPEVHLPDLGAATMRLLEFEDSGEGVACAVAIFDPPGLVGRLRRQESTLVLPTAPAIFDQSFEGAVRDTLFDFARELGAKRVQIQPGYGRWLTGDEELTRFRSGAITEFVIDLTRDYDQILAGMHKIHRKNIRRAARSDLEVVEDSSLEGLLALRAMQLSSSARAGEKTEGFAVRDESYFRRLHEHVYGTGRGTLLFARLDGEPVAALAWIAAAGRIQTVRSGSLPVGYEQRAMYLLHDELIRRALEGSTIELNIGGVPAEASVRDHPQAGLHEFKTGFGGKPVDRYALDIPLHEVGR